MFCSITIQSGTALRLRITLIVVVFYRPNRYITAELHPADEKLLEEEFIAQADHKRYACSGLLTRKIDFI